MASTTKLQLKAAKQRRQKRLAIGGAVLLAVILAIQVPRTMKMLGGSSASPQPAAAPATTTGTPGDAAVPGQVAQPTALPTAATGELPDRNAQPEPGDGQLLSFELFEAKDPFAQQVTNQTDATAVAAAQTAANSAAGTAPSGTTSTGQAPAAGSTETAPTRSTSSVSISVNGSEEKVGVSQTFPANDPTFLLVSSSSDSAKISIAGGRLADGAGTVTLKLGRKLTLVNTADGTRYELELRSTG